MRNLTIFWHLFWKDNRAIIPLAIALLIGAVALQATLTFVSNINRDNYLEQLVVFVGALIPGMFVYGVGPLRVGTEEESGTLSWLSGLPVPWFAITLSKLVASLLWYVIIAMASYALVMFTLNSGIGNFGSNHGMSSEKVGYYFTYGFFVWMLGFLLAYLVRSPILALVFMAPLWLMLDVFLSSSLWSICRNDIYNPSTVGQYVRPIVCFASLTVVTLVLAYLRMTRPWFTTKFSSLTQQSIEPYSPPRSVSQHRPSQWMALMWQQWRQFRWIGFAVLAVAVFPLVLFNVLPAAYRSPRYLPPLDALMAMAALFGASILGTATFTGDATKSKYLFIGERGLSTTRFWLSRLIVSAFFLSLLSVICLCATATTKDDEQFSVRIILACVCLVTWSVGVTSAMMVTRPLLAFFLPFILVVLGVIALGPYNFEYQARYMWTVALACPIALLASWHLCRYWVMRQLGWGYYLRFAAYAAAAYLVPILAVMSIRVATAPRVDSQWEAQMLASSVGLPVYTASSDIISQNIAAGFKEVTLDELRLELDGKDPIGKHVSKMSLMSASGIKQPEETRVLALKVWLNWSHRVREAMCAGKVSPFEYRHYAEDEEIWFLTRVQDLPDKYLPEFVNELSSEDLRKRSRLAAVNKMWSEFHHSLNASNQSKRFAGLTLAADNPWLVVEDWRQNRVVDKVVELITQQIESDQNFRDKKDRTLLNQLLDEAFTEVSARRNSPDVYEVYATSHWINSNLGWVFGLGSTEDGLKRLMRRSSEVAKQPPKDE